ncbi:MAG: GNAT family N-acetyltransferase [Candidatus Diapherotrites archaeon]
MGSLKEGYSYCRYEKGDGKGINRLINEAFKGKREKGYFEWQYLENPAGKPEIRLLKESHNETVGHAAAIPLAFSFFGERKKFLQGMDGALAANARGKGQSRPFFEKFMEEVSGKTEVYFLFPNKAHFERIKNQQGFRHKPLYRLVKPLDSTAILGKISRNKSFTRLMKPLGDVLFKVFFPLKKAALEEGEEIKKIEKFDERADVLWEKTKSGKKIIAERKKDFLNWRYFGGVKKYEAFSLENAGAMEGYIVFAQDGKTGNFADLAATGKKAGEKLLSHALEYLAGKGCEAAFFYTLDDALKERLKKASFIETKTDAYFSFIKTGGIEREISADDWFINLGDSNQV